MNLKSKLLSVLPSVALGGLAFISFISYESVINLSAIQQQNLIKDYSKYVLMSQPDTRASINDWRKWLTTNTYSNHSKFMSILQDDAGKILIQQNGNDSLVLPNYANKLAKGILENKFREQHSTYKDLRYLWYSHKIPDTHFNLLLIYASKPEGISYYIRYLGIPIFIAAAIVLWVSVWLALFLSNLYKQLDAQKKQMEHSALHDALTGLPNRTLFNDRLKQTLNKAMRDKSSFALYMIDLDRFKEINDALGHDYGDKLLIEVAKRLKSALRLSDTVARLGGDEFTIILEQADINRARRIARRISGTLKTEFQIEGKKFHLSGSIGISLYPEHSTELDDLIKLADLTMYRTKQLNHDYEIYSPEHENTQNNNLFLFSDLVDAIKKNQFEIYYQPKYEVQQDKIIGLEALIRWNHPLQGCISPDAFIPVAEVTGLIREISHIVIEQAFKDQSTLHNMGIELCISINLSARDLDNMDIFHFMTEALEKHSASPKRIIFEITESAMMFNSTQTGKILDNIKEYGFKLSIDDFGTGYSSLSNLQQMSIDEIKIDKTFVINMTNNESDSRIVRGTIGLAHDLGIRVVAEGVETDETMNALKALNCDMIQGYAICEPLPLDKLTDKYWDISRNKSLDAHELC